MSSPLEQLPNPTEEQLTSPEFNALWEVMKDWDVEVQSGDGYCSVNGSHVAMLLNALEPVISARCMLTLGAISSELAGRSGAWDGNAPDWFPEPPEWLELWQKFYAESAEQVSDE